MPPIFKEPLDGELCVDHALWPTLVRTRGRTVLSEACNCSATVHAGDRPPNVLRQGPRSGRTKKPQGEPLAAGGATLCTQLGLSSVACTFVPKGEIRPSEAEGYLPPHRTSSSISKITGYQKPYGKISSTRWRRASARQLRKERKSALRKTALRSNGFDRQANRHRKRLGIIFIRISYIDTSGRKWGRPYLTREFFLDELASALAEERCSGNATGASEGFIAAPDQLYRLGEMLYGRPTGAASKTIHPCIFEGCYHQAIDFAIAKGLARLSRPCAQGEHKLAGAAILQRQRPFQLTYNRTIPAYARCLDLSRSGNGATSSNLSVRY